MVLPSGRKCADRHGRGGRKLQGGGLRTGLSELGPEYGDHRTVVGAQPGARDAHLDPALQRTLLSEVSKSAVRRDSPTDNQVLHTVIGAGRDRLGSEHIHYRLLEGRSHVRNADLIACRLLGADPPQHRALQPREGEVVRVSGCVIAGAVFVSAYALEGGGAGDAKLMMAIGAWLGTYPSVVLVLAVTVCGALCALAVTVHRDGWRAVPMLLMHSVYWTRLGGLRLFQSIVSGTIVRHRVVRDERIDKTPKPRPKGWFPYAPSILAGTLVAWWYWQNHGSVI